MRASNSDGSVGLAAPDLVVRQPFPNRLHHVASEKGTPHGALLPLPDPPPTELAVRITWHLPWGDYGSLVGQVLVIHDLVLTLLPTERGRVFSMDAMAHRSLDGAPLPPAIKRQPWSTWCASHLPPERRSAWLGFEGAAFRLRERLTIPGGRISDIRQLEALGR